MRKALGHFRLLVWKWVIQHPHPARVTATQVESVQRLVVSRLSVLQLMKVLVHDRN